MLLASADSEPVRNPANGPNCIPAIITTALFGLSEKQFGGQSGWKYYVNGTAPGKSCVDYTLQDGDRVQWSYVLKAY